MEKVSLFYLRNPTNTNMQTIKKPYGNQKEPLEFIQCQINQIRNSVKDKRSQLTWQPGNEVSRRNSASKAKLKAASQEERLQG